MVPIWYLTGEVVMAEIHAKHERLTKRVVEALLPHTTADYVIWDADITGFGVRVWPSGKKTYLVKYRTKSLGPT